MKVVSTWSHEYAQVSGRVTWYVLPVFAVEHFMRDDRLVTRTFLGFGCFLLYWDWVGRESEA